MSELSKNQKLALTEAEAKLDNFDKQALKIYQSSLKNIRNQLSALAEKIDWSLPELNKYDRLNTLQKQILDEIKTISKDVYKILVKTNEDIVYNTYDRSTFGYVKEIGTNLAFNKINPKVVEAIVKMPYPNIPLKDFIEKLGQDNFNKIKMQIGQGLLQGEGVDKIAKRIRDELGTSYSKAKTIARTEGLRALSQSQLEATSKAESLGIKIVKVWDSVIDKKTRPDHIKMNGVESSEDGNFYLGSINLGPAPRMSNIPEQDINCRCGYTEKIINTGNNIDVSGNKENDLTFEEWQK